jgi:transposase
MARSGERRRPQKYPEELRERAVRMVFEIREQSGEKHGVITRVARELGIGTESLRGWVNQAEVDAGGRPGTSSADAQRIAELEHDNRELRRANDPQEPPSSPAAGSEGIRRQHDDGNRSEERTLHDHAFAHVRRCRPLL